MNKFCIHPLVYTTSEDSGLLHLLEQSWVKEMPRGKATLYIVSGFGNFNGGVRFYKVLEKHVAEGGKVEAVFSGSASSRLTSKQVVAELLRLGAQVRVVNRKRLLHAKLYGWSDGDTQSLIVTSGNFTGPGMSQNVEAAVLLDAATCAGMGFKWTELLTSLTQQQWQYHFPKLDNPTAGPWKLLYDEDEAGAVLDETEESTMIVTLGHSDTARIQAERETNESKGSQYFWLSRDSFDFFPPLTIRNERGEKATYSCLVTMKYLDIDEVDDRCRVTFEAENNLDFRLGTGKLRYTKVAKQGDLAAITRIGESEYELRVIRQGTTAFKKLQPYAIRYIGHRGKLYGMIPNAEFYKTIE